MKESVWGYMIIVFGIISITFIYFFQSITNTDEHNYTLLKETTEAAMYDAIDLATYRATGEIKIESEKFIENFIRRFAQNASLAHTYKVDIYDINETPPKVSLVLSTADKSTTANIKDAKFEFNIINRIDAILETTY